MATAQKRILVVNDEREMLDQIRRWLTLAGYVVECTNTAENGIRIFGETHFDLVLLDYNLKQERNGARTAKAFIPRFKQLNPTIPIIIISATESRLDKDELEVAGVMILHQAIWKELANEIAKIIPT